jgi:hypothetical protein
MVCFLHIDALPEHLSASSASVDMTAYLAPQNLQENTVVEDGLWS